MKKTESKAVKLPILIEKGDDLAKGLSEDKIEELNVRSYDYVRRTAKPRLSDYIITPFSTTIKEGTRRKAEASVGLDSEGLFKKRFEDNDTIISNIKFFTAAYPTHKYGNEAVLQTLRTFLDDVVWRNKQGKKNEGVRKIDNQAYISLTYLMRKIEEARKDEKTSFNKIDLTLKDPETNKRLAYDKEIEEMRVYFDMKRFTHLNPTTAEGFFNAQCLDKRIGEFIEEYTQRQTQRYGVPAHGLEEKILYDYELSDGTNVRFLFYPQHSEKHGEIYSDLTGKTTKAIARSTGDLDIIKEIGLNKCYESIKGGEGIIVTSQSKKGKKGEIHIQRLYKDKRLNHTRSYGIYSDEGCLHIKARDVQKNMKIITERRTSDDTLLKIDTFSAPPDYLK